MKQGLGIALFCAFLILIVFGFTIPRDAAAAAQDSNNAYNVQSFKTYSLDTTDALEKFDKEIKRWLNDHPNIEIVACTEAIVHENNHAIWIRTIYYREKR